MDTGKKDDLTVYFNGLVLDEMGDFSDWDENHSVDADSIFAQTTEKDLNEVADEIFELGF